MLPAWHVTRQVEGHAGQMPASHVRLEAWLSAFKAFFNRLQGMILTPATGISCSFCKLTERAEFIVTLGQKLLRGLACKFVERSLKSGF